MPARRTSKAAPGTAWRSRNGDSYLVCADQAKLFASLPDASVDCVWTDPPYLLSNGGSTCQAGRRVSVDKGEWDQSQGIDADHAFNRAWLAECHRVLKPTGTIWVSGTHHVYLSVGMAMLQLGFRLLNDIVWEKPNPPPNLGCRCFTHATEMLLWAARSPRGDRARYYFDYDAMKAQNGGRQMKNVWRFTAPGKNEKSHGRHPTQKPLKLIERCLEASTRPGDVVLDPFAGSGSTGVAALALGRRFVGAELERDYTRLAARRLRAADASAMPDAAVTLP
ncbi:MAG: site-specific DNA-methyltransferase [Gammaproteobacteria bacterium]